jgi:hypothetical protein
MTNAIQSVASQPQKNATVRTTTIPAAYERKWINRAQK